MENIHIAFDPGSPEGDKCVKVWYKRGSDGSIIIDKVEQWVPEVIRFEQPR